jgi:aspartate/methionine/tyrosine aminotransferase
MFLQNFPPMGVYETLFKFQDATGNYMGDAGTRPWAQGFPLTRQLPGGPTLPLSVEFPATELKYPAATGNEGLRKAISKYYSQFYGAGITEDNVAVFAGGRPGIFATLLFLQKDVEVVIEETEYTPYYDKLKILERSHTIVPSNPSNNFRPTLSDYTKAIKAKGKKTLLIRSNPCNPTGVTLTGQELQDFVKLSMGSDRGAIIDEAYEFFNTTGPVSAMEHIRNIDDTNIFVIGAATKGLQVPGMRTGWVVASKKHIEIFRNFSSIAMGGVSRPAQIYVTNLLETERVKQARQAVVNFYNEQRKMYQEGLASCGIELCTGEGGFYHWGRLPNGLTAEAFNKRLFDHKAAILPGTLCDMHRRGDTGPHGNFIRFSFGPLEPSTYSENIKIIKDCLQA